MMLVRRRAGVSPLKEAVKARECERQNDNACAANDERYATRLERRQRELLKDNVHLGRIGAARHGHGGGRDLGQYGRARKEGA